MSITQVGKSTIATSVLFGYISLGDLADPTGTVDSTAAIVAALSTGLPVYVPAGIFLVTSFTVPTGGVIFGSGIRSVLKVMDLTNAVNITVGSSAHLRDIAIDGNKTNQVGSGLHVVQFMNSVTSTLQNVSVSNSKGDCINISGAATDGVELFNCSTKGFTESGIHVVAGTNIRMDNPYAGYSDIVASGDGIQIASAGLAISNIQINNAVARNNNNRGISLLGSGTRNVTKVSIVNPRVLNNLGNGIHLINADSCTITAGMSLSNGIDGVRLEGDVQNCRVSEVISESNTSFGIREITVGSTPNFNGLIYNISLLNGNNTITKVGASSYVV